MNLENFLKLGREAAVNYDLKNQFRHQLYAGEFEELTSLDEWSIYKAKSNKLKIDCDVSKLSVDVAHKLYNKNLNLQSTVHKQSGNHYKFELVTKKHGVIRIDTMNSMWTVLKQVIQMNHRGKMGKLNQSYFDMCESLEININKGLAGQVDKLVGKYDEIIDHKQLLNLLNEFAQITHSIGNLLLYPATEHSINFNINRGIKKEIQDYFDLTLVAIKEWYLERDKENPLQKVLNENKAWFGMFGKGLAGWRNYVELNYLEEFTEGSDYKPILFWEDHSFENPSIEKHLQTYLNKSELEARLIQFLTFVNHAIRKRGERIYNVLIS